MRFDSKHLSLRTTVILTFAVLVVAAKAQEPLPFLQTITFGMIGLASNQTARLSALNSSFPGEGQPACSAELSFLDAEGRVLKSSRFNVEEQKAVSLDLQRS